MQSKPGNWKDTIRLTPFSGVQMLDFTMNLDETPRFSRDWIERRDASERTKDDMVPLILLANYPENHPDHDRHLKERADDEAYTINKQRALEPFLDQWVPVPLLRTKPGADALGREPLDEGPTNWARVRVNELSTADQARLGVTHAVTLAVDTQLSPRRENRAYTTPSSDDAKEGQEFRLSGRYAEMGWFLANRKAAVDGAEVDFQSWVSDWVTELFHEFKRRQRPGRELTADDFPYRLESWARYLTFIEFIAEVIGPVRVRLVDSISENPDHKPVNVDIVLDLGNSRSCAMLIESYPNERTVDLNNSMVLRLRDLDQTEHSHTGPFESHVEFAAARFGKDHLSSRSGRGRAFFWPSLVRVGPEATRKREAAEGTQSYTGLSSPKRYVWDTEAVTQPWRFQKTDYGRDGSEPTIARAVRRYINDRGDVIEQLKADEHRLRLRVNEEHKRPARLLSCSRSSLLSFMIGEIVCHALQMINDPQVRRERRNPDAPRILRNVILTIPPATPLQEQQLIRSRAEAAVRLIWELAGWRDTPGAPVQPAIRAEWDEASCSQFVYLYGEIVKQYRGAASAFFQLAGRDRPYAEPEQHPQPDAEVVPSLRVASIDLGGGTTDLMVTTYYTQRDRAILPSQNFREGFRIAGDDVVRAVIERVVLPAIEQAMKATGCESASEFIEDRFGGDRVDMPEQEKQARREFVLRVLRPIALEMLEIYEGAGLFERDRVEVRRFEDFFSQPDDEDPRPVMPPERLRRFLEAECEQRGGVDFSLLEVEFPIAFEALNAVIAQELGQIAGLLAEAIEAYDCDVVLLTGRPSRLPGVRDLFAEQLAVTPDRIVPMDRYRAGIWYPFRSTDNTRIDDPKTTVVVGAMLCALAEHQIEGFTIFTDRLVMRSTARFIGEMMNDGQITEDRVLFSDVDLDNKGSAQESATLEYFNPLRIGFRQLPHERWAATPLYRLELQSGGVDNVRKPVEVVIIRADRDEPDEDATSEEMRFNEARKEFFIIDDLQDADGAPLKKETMHLTLDTLCERAGYWLDSGILKTMGKG